MSMFDREMFRDIAFYARLFKEKYSDEEQIKKAISELGELDKELEQWRTTTSVFPSAKMMRVTYEDICRETWDVLIVLVELMLIFEDEPMWLMTYHEKIRQWREHLDLSEPQQ